MRLHMTTCSVWKMATSNEASEVADSSLDTNEEPREFDHLETVDSLNSKGGMSTQSTESSSSSSQPEVASIVLLISFARLPRPPRIVREKSNNKKNNCNVFQNNNTIIFQNRIIAKLSHPYCTLHAATTVNVLSV